MEAMEATGSSVEATAAFTEIESTFGSIIEFKGPLTRSGVCAAALALEPLTPQELECLITPDEDGAAAPPAMAAAVGRLLIQPFDMEVHFYNDLSSFIKHSCYNQDEIHPSRISYLFSDHLTISQHAFLLKAWGVLLEEAKLAKWRRREVLRAATKQFPSSGKQWADLIAFELTRARPDLKAADGGQFILPVELSQQEK